MLTVIRYIHNNPVKAGMVQEPEEYRWSSIHAYYGIKEYPYGLSEPALSWVLLIKTERKHYRRFENLLSEKMKIKALS